MKKLRMAVVWPRHGPSNSTRPTISISMFDAALHPWGHMTRKWFLKIKKNFDIIQKFTSAGDRWKRERERERAREREREREREGGREGGRDPKVCSRLRKIQQTPKHPLAT